MQHIKHTTHHSLVILSNLRTKCQECAINNKEGKNRQDDWGQKLGSGKHDLAGTLMMSNPYTGSVGRFWWRRQAWFTTMAVLGEWRWALPEAEWLVCVCVFVPVVMFVFAILTLNLDRIINGTRQSSDQINTQVCAHKFPHIYAYVHVKTHKARKKLCISWSSKQWDGYIGFSYYFQGGQLWSPSHVCIGVVSSLITADIFPLLFPVS